MFSNSTDEATQSDEDLHLGEEIERFLGTRYVERAQKIQRLQELTLYLIGDNAEYLQHLAVELDTQHNFRVISQSKSGIEWVLPSLNHDSLDVILIDVRFTMTHHIKTTQVLRHVYSNAAIVAIMPDLTPLHLRQARWCGVNGCILKGASAAEIADKLIEVRNTIESIDSALT